MKVLLEFLERTWLHKTLVGAPVLLIFLILVLGSDGAFGLLLASIVCTAGIGGIFWGFVAFIIGLVLTVILKSVYNKPPVTGAETKLSVPPAAIDKDLISIWEYIRDARAYGFTDTEIKAKLMATGWTEEKINLAYNLPL